MSQPLAENGTPAYLWTVSGNVEFPVTESATNIKLMASYNILDYSGGSISSNVVTLTPSGNPPTADFVIDVDGNVVSEGSIMLHVFNDKNDNGINDFSEEIRSLSPKDATSAVWGNGVYRSLFASFRYLTQGYTSSGSSSYGGSWTFRADVTGWYLSDCNNDSCMQLITQEANNFTGAKLRYYPGSGDPMQIQ